MYAHYYFLSVSMFQINFLTINHSFAILIHYIIICLYIFIRLSMWIFNFFFKILIVRVISVQWIFFFSCANQLPYYIGTLSLQRLDMGRWHCCLTLRETVYLILYKSVGIYEYFVRIWDPSTCIFNIIPLSYRFPRKACKKTFGLL